MNFLYCGNQKVIRGLELSILSILEDNPGPHHFYVFSMDVPSIGEKGIGIHEDDLTKLREVLASYHKDNVFTLVDVKNEFEKRIVGTRYEEYSYTPYCLIRLFADKYVKEDRLLYLDIDTMCYKNLSKFEELDMTNKEVALVKDTLGRFWVHYDYFNAGVLYLNMKLCKENSVFPRALNYLLSHKLYFGDQSALYHTFDKKIYLSRDFNEQRKVRPTTVIKHFCQGIIWFPFQVYNIKQWQVSKLHKKLKCHDFDRIFDLYNKLFNKSLD